jgi:hypothetical protein
MHYPLRSGILQDICMHCGDLAKQTKQSIAKTFAQFFNVPVYGATSGSHIAVRHHNKWVKSSQYKSETGHWPGPNLPIKLVPDKGEYYEYLP